MSSSSFRFSSSTRWRTIFTWDWSANCSCPQAKAANLSGTKRLLIVLLSGQPAIIETKSSITLSMGLCLTLFISIFKCLAKISIKLILWAYNPQGIKKPVIDTWSKLPKSKDLVMVIFTDKPSLLMKFLAYQCTFS